MKNNSSHGFHLIEILTTVAILGIIITLSFPLYSQYLITTRRMEAATTLGKLAIALELYHTEHNSYHAATLAALKFPEMIAGNNYKLSIESASVHSYMVMATHVGNQARKDPACSALILYADGKMDISGTGNVKDCW